MLDRLLLLFAILCNAGGLLAQDTWRELPMPSMHLQAWGCPGVSGSTWVIPQSYGAVGISHNSGAMVTHRQVDPSNRKLTHAAAIDENIAVVGGDGGAMYRTLDGGESWVPVLWNGASSIRAMVATSHGGVLVVDKDNALYRSVDAGRTFLDDPPTLPSIVDRMIASITGDTLYAYGRQCPGYLVSTDDGATWSRSTEPTAGIPRDVTVGNDGTLVVLDERSALWIRSSAGAQWKWIDSTFPADQWERVSYASSDTLLLVKGEGSSYMEVYRAVGNGGIHWEVSSVSIYNDWRGGMQARATDKGVLLLKDQATVQVEWNGMVTGLCDPTEGREWKTWRTTAVGGLESGPSLGGIVTGSTSKSYEGWYPDGHIDWIVRYDRDSIEREVAIHSFVNDDGTVSRSLGITALSSYPLSVTGRPTFYSMSLSRLLYSDDDGKTWSFSSKVPNLKGWLGPSVISQIDESTLLAGRAVVKPGTTKELTLYLSKDRGESWDSVLVPVDLPIKPATYEQVMDVYAYARGRVLGYMPRGDSLELSTLIDIDWERGTVNMFPEKIYRGNWAVLGGRYLVNAHYNASPVVYQDDTVHIEVYDIVQQRRISDLVLPKPVGCIRMMSITVVSDSVALVNGFCSTAFLTLDAGRTWQEYALPDVDSSRHWYVWTTRRIQPGRFLASAYGYMHADYNRRKSILVEFTPSWDPIPVSVESAAPASSPSALAISPNPSRNGLISVDIPEDLDGDLTWLIIDMLGRVVDNGVVDIASGRRISTSEPLSAGLYTVMLQSRTGRRMARFVVQP